MIERKNKVAFDFEKLDVYTKAIEFARKIYKETKYFPKDEIFGLSSQLRRAAISISANIAEGSGRYHKKDFSQFLRISRGSVCECIPLLQIAKEENYIKQNIYIQLVEDCNEISRMLSGLIKSLAN